MDATHLRWLLQEILQEVLKQFIRVVNSVGVLPDYPNHGRFRFRRVQRIQMFAKRCYDAFILIWVPAKNIFDDDHGFLHNVADLGRNQLEQDSYTFVCCT